MAPLPGSAAQRLARDDGGGGHAGARDSVAGRRRARSARDVRCGPPLSRAGCGSAATREDSRYAGRFGRSPRRERSLKNWAAPIASGRATNTIATVLENVPRGSNHQAQAGIAATSSHAPGRPEPSPRIVAPLRCSITSRTIPRHVTATSPASPIRGVPLQPERAITANMNIQPNSISTSSRRTSALALTM